MVDFAVEDFFEGVFASEEELGEYGDYEDGDDVA